MGDCLVVYTVSEEALGWGQLQRELRARAGDGERSAQKLGSRSSRKRMPSSLDFRQRAMTEMGIPEGGIWEPPSEPEVHEWWRKPELRRRHAEAVRRSLEEFLNGHLARLYHMFRTGWWVLGKVRVRVVECRPVPEREMRAMARATNRGKRAVRLKRKARRH
jgi:hypothetical protein